MYDFGDVLNSLVYRTNIILKGQLQASLKNFDITSEQWVMLARLYKKDGYNQKELAVESFKEQAAVTRTLDILESKGLAERRKSPSDRREYLVFMTEKGKAFFEESLPNVKEYLEVLDSTLSHEEMETLKALLRKLYKNLQPDI